MSAALATVDTQIVRVHMNRHAQPDPDRIRCGSRTGWAVCQTHPQAERWARDQLRNQGYEVYLPLHTVTRRDPVLRTLTRQVEAPLFTSYLFVCIRSPHWSPIAHTLGVRRLLMSAGNPYILRDGIVSTLEASAASRLYPPTDPPSQWPPGTPCALANGSLKGHEGVVLSVNRLTATVGLLLFGQMREVSVPLTSLAPRNAE